MTCHRFARRAGSILIAALALAFAASAAASPISADERAVRVEQVRRTELAFAATVKENRPSDFAFFLDDEAAFVGAGGVTRGRDAVVAAWAVFFGADRPAFEWHPEIVELSADGTLGLSRGPWTLRVRQPDGREVEERGLFNSVWQRQNDGSWKIVFDAGCACPPGGE